MLLAKIRWHQRISTLHLSKKNLKLKKKICSLWKKPFAKIGFNTNKKTNKTQQRSTKAPLSFFPSLYFHRRKNVSSHRKTTTCSLKTSTVLSNNSGKFLFREKCCVKKHHFRGYHGDKDNDKMKGTKIRTIVHTDTKYKRESHKLTKPTVKTKKALLPICPQAGVQNKQ